MEKSSKENDSKRLKRCGRNIFSINSVTISTPSAVRGQISENLRQNVCGDAGNPPAAESRPRVGEKQPHETKPLFVCGLWPRENNDGGVLTLSKNRTDSACERAVSGCLSELQEPVPGTLEKAARTERGIFAGERFFLPAKHERRILCTAFHRVLGLPFRENELP